MKSKPAARPYTHGIPCLLRGPEAGVDPIQRESANRGSETLLLTFGHGVGFLIASAARVRDNWPRNYSRE